MAWSDSRCAMLETQVVEVSIGSGWVQALSPASLSWASAHRPRLGGRFFDSIPPKFKLLLGGVMVSWMLKASSSVDKRVSFYTCKEGSIVYNSLMVVNSSGGWFIPYGWASTDIYRTMSCGTVPNFLERLRDVRRRLVRHRTAWGHMVTSIRSEVLRRVSLEVLC